MKRIDHKSIKIVNSFACDKSGFVFYRNLELVPFESRDKVNCYVQIKGRYQSGEYFNEELKISYKLYSEILDQIVENSRKSKIHNRG